MGKNRMRIRPTWISLLVSVGLIATGWIWSFSPAASAATKTITVGGVFTRTGPVGVTQPGSYEGASAYIKNLNAHGGVDGYKIKFIGLDDQGSTSNAVADYKTLINQDHAVALIEGDEQVLIGAATAVEGSGVPLIGCTFAPACYGNNGMYPVEPFVESVYPATEATFLKERHITKLAELTLNVPAAVESAQLASPYLKTAGIKVVFSTAYDPTTTDFTALTARAKASGAQAVQFIVGDPTTANAFMTSMGTQNYNALVYSFYEQAYATTFPSSASGKYFGAEGVIGYGSKGEKALATIKKDFPSLTSPASGVSTWTAMEALTAAITKVGSKPVTSANIEKKLDTFTNFQSTFLAPITWHKGANENPSHCAQVGEILNGKWILAEKTPGVPGPRFTCWTESTAPPSS
jgi:branched-chain amino acid transport system substrate-binding protein